jgi:hypothetical protein
MFQRDKFLLLSITLFAQFSYGQAGFEKIEIATDKGCLYSEYTTPSRTELRKKSVVNWSGGCANGYINGNGVLTLLSADGTQVQINGIYKDGLENGEATSLQTTDKGKTIFKGIFKDGFRLKGDLENQNINGDWYKYSGEFSNGRFHGYGKLENSKYTYEGQFKNGALEGKGKFKYADGGAYEGDVLIGKLNGKGILTYPNGDIYEGEFLDGIRTGKGIYKFKNNAVMDGAFLNNQFTGDGRYTYPDGGNDVGIFLNGKLNGKGHRNYSNGNQIFGNFLTGNLEGHGKFLSKDGTTYEGSFKNSVPDGVGIWKFANGDFHEGNNSNGKMNGSGVLKMGDSGEVIEGLWIDNKLSGRYKVTKRNGDIFQANIENGKVEGTAIYTKSNGDKWYQEYKNGVKVSETAGSSNTSSSSQNSTFKTPQNITSYEAEYAQAKQRQKGIDSLTCEAYAKNSTSNQQAAPPPGPAGLASLASIFAQTALIGMNTQEYYDSCMKRLGY